MGLFFHLIPPALGLMIVLAIVIKVKPKPAIVNKSVEINDFQNKEVRSNG